MNVEKALDNGVLLKEEVVSFGGMLLEYRLFVCNTYADRFRIRVAKGEERAEYGVGNDLDVALRYYRAVVRGRVTPCGLFDVMCELCKEG